MAAVQRMQFDNRNAMAPTLVPALLAVPLDGLAARVQSLLRGWDYQQPESSAAAAYYNAVWRHLLRRTFDELPAEHRPDGGDRWFEVVPALLADPGSRWWDAAGTPAVETAPEVLAVSMRDAAEQLPETQGDDPREWRWGRMHTLTVRNQTVGKSGVGVVEWLFNHGPAPIAGGDAIVNATGWHAGVGYEVDAVPSMRMIVDMSNLDRSRWIQLTGHSGHAFLPHYDDQFEPWRTGQTLPTRWEPKAIEGAATETLVLTAT